MIGAKSPFVSFVTPVYNGGPYLREAVDSVLAQDYDDWEYIIVNNCSTDDTLQIAERYSALDARIRVVSNRDFLDCEQNHNEAFRQISPASDFCKVVSADDWLLPGALHKWLSVAMRHPTAGIVGSYQRSGDAIRWQGLPVDRSFFSGREVCRLGLLDDVHVLGNPMSVLYRSSILRRTRSFHPHSRPHADTSAFYAALRFCDFGFVHEVLSVERLHESQESARVRDLAAWMPASVETLLDYGRYYLSDEEFERRRRELMQQYYEMLARQVLRLRGAAFWKYHGAAISDLGMRLDPSRIAVEVARKALHGLTDPAATVERLGALLGRKSAS